MKLIEIWLQKVFMNCGLVTLLFCFSEGKKTIENIDVHVIIIQKIEIHTFILVLRRTSVLDIRQNYDSVYWTLISYWNTLLFIAIYCVSIITKIRNDAFHVICVTYEYLKKKYDNLIIWNCLIEYPSGVINA